MSRPNTLPVSAQALRQRGLSEPLGLRIALTTVALGFLGLFVVAPVLVVFGQALSKGIGAYFAAFRTTDALAAVRLTLLTAAIAVPLNTAFGLVAGWAIAKFRFPGRNALITWIDLPLSVSPVIAGMVFVLLFGRSGLFGPWFTEHGVKIIFSTPGVILATVFVTLPLVAREVIPVMQAGGTEDEEAARVLGAGGWSIFTRVTLPNIKWGVLYGAIICNARAMGEFGAVSVVSGHIRGQTNTLPLHVEILYNEYNFQSAFAVASLLVFLALVTILVRSAVEWRARQAAAEMEALSSGEEPA